MKEVEFVEIEKAIGYVHIDIALSDGATFLSRNPTSKVFKVATLLKFNEYCDVLNDPELLKRAKEFIEYKKELERKKALEWEKKHEEWLKMKNTPLNQFITILRNRWHISQPEKLQQWCNSTSLAEKQKTLQEFSKLASSRGLPLDDTQITFGLSFLNATILNNHSKKQSFLTKIAERVAKNGR